MKRSQQVLNLQLENVEAGAHLFRRTLNNANALTKEFGNNDVIDLSKGMDNIMGSLAKFGYMPGSDISIIISVTCVCFVLKDKELNKQFLDKDGKVDLFKLRAIFPYVGTKGNGIGYTSLFSNEEYVRIADKTMREHLVLGAYKSKLAAFPVKIANFTSGDGDDLVRIGKDLEIASTVISELELDAAKNEEKREGMISIEDFMNTRLKQQSRNLSFMNNFQDIVSYMNGYSSKAVTKLVYGFANTKTMFDFDDYYAAKEEEYLTQLKESGEYSIIDPDTLKSELYKLKLQVRSECMIVDPLFSVVEAMMETVKDTLSKLADCYVESDMKIFKGLSILPQRNEEDNLIEHESLEDSILSVKKTALIVYEMINNAFIYNKLIPMMKIEDIAKVGRNVIYNAGAVRGFTPHDTFLMAADAGWYKRKSNGNIVNTANTNREHYKFAAVEAVFGTELKHYLNPNAMRKAADLEIPPEVLDSNIFEPGSVLAFKDGQCLVPLGDEVHTIIRLDELDYTGYLLLVVNEEEGYAEFIENTNQYAYDEIDYVIFDNIADITARSNSVAPEEFEALLVDAEINNFAMSNRYKTSKLTLKTKSEKEGVFFLTDEERVREAARIAPLVEYWENIIKLEYVKGLNSGIEQNHYYLSDATGKGRILGKVHDSFLEEDKEYNNIFTIATPVGAIMVKNIVAEA